MLTNLACDTRPYASLGWTADATSATYTGGDDDYYSTGGDDISEYNLPCDLSSDITAMFAIILFPSSSCSSCDTRTISGTSMSRINAGFFKAFSDLDHLFVSQHFFVEPLVSIKG
jgi:hypothetical protein